MAKIETLQQARRIINSIKRQSTVTTKECTKCDPTTEWLKRDVAQRYQLVYGEWIRTGNKNYEWLLKDLRKELPTVEEQQDDHMISKWYNDNYGELQRAPDGYNEAEYTATITKLDSTYEAEHKATDKTLDNIKEEADHGGNKMVKKAFRRWFKEYDAGAYKSEYKG